MLGRRLHSVRHIARHGENIAGLEVLYRTVADVDVALADRHVADLLGRMRMGRIGLRHRAVVEIDDHGHQVVQVDELPGDGFAHLDRVGLVVFQKQVHVLKIKGLIRIIHLQGQFGAVHGARGRASAAVAAGTIRTASGVAGFFRAAAARNAVSGHQGQRCQPQGRFHGLFHTVIVLICDCFYSLCGR